MQHSSASVAALASALAKAQAELSNPEKSLLARLPAERGQAERSFRYAPLSSGLDIVRKTLGRNEIAIIQATAIDRESGMVKLTTTLAHASGEWVASDWPVCPLAELPTPHRMGAALTYARRYALFTLVGIAGEDDLDAPDLALRSGAAAPSGATVVPAASPAPVAALQRTNGKSPTKPLVTLTSEDSKLQRDQLLAELASISSPDDAAKWAKRTLPIKNTLAREHADEVEAAFEGMFARFADSVAATVVPPERHSHAKSDEEDTAQPTSPADEVTLEFGYPRRHRDKVHLKFVASQPCLICNRCPCDAHHLRFAQVRALSRKVSDEFTVPLCRTHHRQLHRTGKEREWWTAMNSNLDPLKIAEALWQQSRKAQQPAGIT